MSTPSKATKTPCERCGAPQFASFCTSCKAAIRLAEAARLAKREREQAARGYVGDERHTERVKRAFDVFSASVREAAGLPSRRA